MLFTLQKIIWFLLLPPASLLLIMAAGLLVMEKRRKTGRALLLTGFAALYVLSLAPTADLILRPLERQTPPIDAGQVLADAVVVPGGGSVDLAWMGAEPRPNAESLSRLVTAVEFARALNVPLVLCGGNGEPFATRIKDADTLAAAAYRLGMPRKQVVVENESRNTLENSYAVRELVRGDRIVLATSAYYMRRARTMFERRGFTVIPAATYHLVQSRKASATFLIPGARHLERSTIGLAEWISMLWWKLRGEI